jgi:hypothetical protein
MSEAPNSTPDDLRREITRILGGKGMSSDFGHGADYRAFTPAAPDSRLRPAGRTATPAERGPFGRWLLMQAERGGLVGDLAKGAMADRGFPRDGDPEAVRKRLSMLQADGDMFEALDEAELDWASY